MSSPADGSPTRWPPASPSAPAARWRASEAESAILGRGAAILDRWRKLQAVGVLLAVAGLASVAMMLLTHADPQIAHGRTLSDLSLGDGYALFIRGALGFLALGMGLGLIIPDESALDGIAGPATIAPILLCSFLYFRAKGQSFIEAFGLAPPAGAGPPSHGWRWP